MAYTETIIAACGRHLGALFTKRAATTGDPRPGVWYRRLRTDHTEERAEVLAVYSDPMGIRHVRYLLMLQPAHGQAYEEGMRVLAAQAFLDRYRQLAAA
ncbi:MAG: hypothetical protein ACREGL_07480 [Alphaproteobacteria bacterium]